MVAILAFAPMLDRHFLRRVASDLRIRPIADEFNRVLKTWSPAILARNARVRRDVRPGDLPLPPANLVYLVAHTSDLQWFLESGRASAGTISGALDRAGRPLTGMRQVLDLGCGCGRVLRQWQDTAGPQFFGSDFEPAAVAWVGANLPYVTASVNNLAPPLPFADASFDLVYTISVFTHWSEELQGRWMAEMRRILRPDGILLLTTLGEHYLATFSPEERRRFEAGQIVVRDANLPGTNLCLTFHPPAYVRRMAEGFEVVEFVPKGALGSPYQDLWLLSRRAT